MRSPGKQTGKAQWSNFTVDGVLGGPIRLEQNNRKEFTVQSAIRYEGKLTGLEKRFSKHSGFDDIREVRPRDLVPATDLVSVPRPLRWFAGRYGDHTAAALVHDRFIGIEKTDLPKPIPEMTDAHADRFFRFMLHDTGIPWIRRWVMWAGVAFRTRFNAVKTAPRPVVGWAKTLSVVVWAAAIVAAVVGGYWFARQGEWGAVLLVALVPIPLSALWWHQFGAGLVAAYAMPVLLPPTLLAVVADLILFVLDQLSRPVQPSSVKTSAPAPVRMESFQS